MSWNKMRQCTMITCNDDYMQWLQERREKRLPILQPVKVSRKHTREFALKRKYVILFARSSQNNTRTNTGRIQIAKELDNVKNTICTFSNLCANPPQLDSLPPRKPGDHDELKVNESLVELRKNLL